jgi:predicted Zn-dependent protease
MGIRGAVIILVLAGLMSGCSTVPLTGRNQISLVSSTEMQSMSYQQYGEFLKTNKESTDKKAAEMVTRVGSRIQKAVEIYFTQNNLTGRLNGYKWEYHLIESKDVNAWCMPGGKVVVYTGILPVTQDENGLAVVLGHEISHAIAEHGSERMSQELVVQLGGVALTTALQNKSSQTQSIWSSVYGLGAQYGALLPYSRLHESEADHLGLIFMAMAGYDPNTALTFWQRMAQQSQSQAPPEFMSTHPSDATRIARIRGELPEALKYYKKSK